jgi:uncharacterized protein YecT (DUF1311 family)
MQVPKRVSALSRRRSAGTLAFLCSLIAHSASFADVPTFEQVQEECAEFGFAGAMASCYLDKDKTLGVELAVVYGQLRRCYSKAHEGALVASQRAWVTYQEQTCGFREKAFKFEGPSIARRAYAGCLVKTTIERMQELRTLLEEGDCAIQQGPDPK